jgi:hypothetical protein
VSCSLQKKRPSKGPEQTWFVVALGTGAICAEPLNLPPKPGFTSRASSFLEHHTDVEVGQQATPRVVERERGMARKPRSSFLPGLSGWGFLFGGTRANIRLGMEPARTSLLQDGKPRLVGFAQPAAGASCLYVDALISAWGGFSIPLTVDREPRSIPTRSEAIPSGMDWPSRKLESAFILAI